MAISRKVDLTKEFAKEEMKKGARLQRHVNTLRFSPISIAHFAAMVYEKRVFSKVSFEVALAKIAMMTSEEVGEKIAMFKSEIEEEFREIMKGVRICEHNNLGSSHLSQTELSLG